MKRSELKRKREWNKKRLKKNENRWILHLCVRNVSPLKISHSSQAVTIKPRRLDLITLMILQPFRSLPGELMTKFSA